MKKTIKAWAEFNAEGRLNLRTIEETQWEVKRRIKELYAWEWEYCKSLGICIRRITIIVED